MPRRGFVPKRDVLPDPMYNSKVVTKLINSIMLDGKKGTAQKVVYGAFDIIREKTGKEPVEVFEQALRWITQFSRTRSEKTMKERLAAELMDATNGLGASFRRKEEMHRQAEANKAFAHYRW